MTIEKIPTLVELQVENAKLKSINTEIIEGRDKKKSLNNENSKELLQLREFKLSSERAQEKVELGKRISLYNIKEKFLPQVIKQSGITLKSTIKEIESAMLVVKDEYGEYFKTDKPKTDTLDFTPLDEVKTKKPTYDDLYKELIENAKIK